MKKIGVLFMFISLVACKNVEQYKAGIQELASKFESTTSDVSGFAKIVEGENGKLASAMQALGAIAPEVMAKLKPADKTTMEAAAGDVKSASSNMSAMLGEVTNYVTEWSAKGTEIKALQDGLAAGKLEGDVTAKIAELTSYVADGTTKLSTWKEAFSAVQAKGNASLTALEAAMKLLPAAAPAK